MLTSQKKSVFEAICGQNGRNQQDIHYLKNMHIKLTDILVDMYKRCKFKNLSFLTHFSLKITN
ncbi:hypothetical protein BC349_03610 [Flavihumibacter stibioxidans]|uniref:Uncharacterized protein n=1 Tax=Flavihumibacter stibioxidans TaxID=1834163 RepID=A0ABR7M4Y6_9BACT|nr:hypothetical protein [Flavihumibacter stibioxidans]